MSEKVIKNSTDLFKIAMPSEIKSEKCENKCENDDYDDKTDSDKYDGDKCGVKEDDEGKTGCHRENRLTTIIDQLRCQSKLKVCTPPVSRGGRVPSQLHFFTFTAFSLELVRSGVCRLAGNVQRDNFTLAASNGEGGGGGGARRCARDAASPAHAHAPPAPPSTHTVKSERLSPHDSNTSRSRSVTPSTSSYPSTPPERGSPHAPPPTPANPPRNYSDIMRSLAARYNTHPSNDYFHRVNGFGVDRPAQTSVDVNDVPVGGLFAKLAKQQGGPLRLPAFPLMLDMTSTKTLLTISRVGRGGRSRRKRFGAAAAEHSPLDLSAAGESAAKRARLSAGPSPRGDGDEKDRVYNEDRGDVCLCSEARARLAAMSVDDVREFVGSIDICEEYATNFVEQSIDGSGLPLLTEEHLTGMLKMKLGPALKLRAVVARSLQPCAQCLATATAAATATATTSATATTTTPKINGSLLKSEPRSNTTSPS